MVGAVSLLAKDAIPGGDSGCEQETVVAACSVHVLKVDMACADFSDQSAAQVGLGMDREQLRVEALDEMHWALLAPGAALAWFEPGIAEPPSPFAAH